MTLTSHYATFACSQRMEQMALRLQCVFSDNMLMYPNQRCDVKQNRVVVSSVECSIILDLPFTQTLIQSLGLDSGAALKVQQQYLPIPFLYLSHKTQTQYKHNSPALNTLYETGHCQHEYYLPLAIKPNSVLESFGINCKEVSKQSCIESYH